MGGLVQYFASQNNPNPAYNASIIQILCTTPAHYKKTKAQALAWRGAARRPAAARVQRQF
jgi:hypothetical protein